ncbi:sodium:solute symporter family transporter [Haloarchaeobius sp. DFWS5]|uniref:sodium:solute symporter family transporter n=1 Tax=Haloarchaeobius sp. DFWS5 TaxID=3446114 RepID=UPI003EBEA49C
MAGILLAALAAAVTSSGDSFLLSGASNFVEDIYLWYMNPEADNEKQQQASLVAVLGLMVFSLALALIVPDIIDLTVFDV